MTNKGSVDNSESDRKATIAKAVVPPEIRMHVRHFYFFGQDSEKRTYHSGLAGTVALKYDKLHKALKFAAVVVHKNDLGKADKRSGYAGIVDRMSKNSLVQKSSNKLCYTTPVLWILEALAETDKDAAEEIKNWVNGTKKGLSAHAVRHVAMLYLDSYARNIKSWFAKGELLDVMVSFLGEDKVKKAIVKVKKD